MRIILQRLTLAKVALPPQLGGVEAFSAAFDGTPSVPGASFSLEPAAPAFSPSVASSVCTKNRRNGEILHRYHSEMVLR